MRKLEEQITKAAKTVFPENHFRIEMKFLNDETWYRINLSPAKLEPESWKATYDFLIQDTVDRIVADPNYPLILMKEMKLYILDKCKSENTFPELVALLCK